MIKLKIRKWKHYIIHSIYVSGGVTVPNMLLLLSQHSSICFWYFLYSKWPFYSLTITCIHFWLHLLVLMGANGQIPLKCPHPASLSCQTHYSPNDLKMRGSEPLSISNSSMHVKEEEHHSYQMEVYYRKRGINCTQSQMLGVLRIGKIKSA